MKRKNKNKIVKHMFDDSILINVGTHNEKILFSLEFLRNRCGILKNKFAINRLNNIVDIDNIIENGIINYNLENIFNYKQLVENNSSIDFVFHERKDIKEIFILYRICSYLKDIETLKYLDNLINQIIGYTMDILMDFQFMGLLMVFENFETLKKLFNKIYNKYDKMIFYNALNTLKYYELKDYIYKQIFLN